MDRPEHPTPATDPVSAAPDSLFPPKPTALLRSLVRERLRDGALAIDATAGNGHDTLWLAHAVGPSGRVIAFDVQPAALAAAASRVAAAGLAERVCFHQASHARMAEFTGTGAVSAVVFNLGYLPGANHGTTTTTGETVLALDAATGLLEAGGVLAVVCYPGHEEGAREAAEATRRFDALAGRGWRVARYGAMATLRPAPFLLIASAPD